MARILLGVTGSVAAIRTPMLFEALRGAGHEVRVVATNASLYFFEPAQLAPIDPARPERNREVVVLDEDEWPGRGRGRRFNLGEPVLHIELRRWAELFLVAPLDANTLAKLAAGLCDNCLTCTWRAWDSLCPIVLAPAMNSLMWEHPLTIRHLCALARDVGNIEVSDNLSLDEIVETMNRSCPRLAIVPPQSKQLACGDVGVGAMAAIEEITTVVARLTRHDQEPRTK